MLLLLVTMLLAVLAWKYAATRKTTGPQLRPRAVGPDDDPDFLRELSRRAPPDEDPTK